MGQGVQRTRGQGQARRVDSQSRSFRRPPRAGRDLFKLENYNEALRSIDPYLKRPNSAAGPKLLADAYRARGLAEVMLGHGRHASAQEATLWMRPSSLQTWRSPRWRTTKATWCRNRGSNNSSRSAPLSHSHVPFPPVAWRIAAL
jgi:hypothetical protein